MVTGKHMRNRNKEGLMGSEEKREWAVKMLQQKAGELERLPKKADFEVVEFQRIKAVLGPWPRALESAGLKQRKPKPQRNRSQKGKDKV